LCGEDKHGKGSGQEAPQCIDLNVGEHVETLQDRQRRCPSSGRTLLTACVNGGRRMHNGPCAVGMRRRAPELALAASTSAAVAAWYRAGNPAQSLRGSGGAGVAGRANVPRVALLALLALGRRPDRGSLARLPALSHADTEKFRKSYPGDRCLSASLAPVPAVERLRPIFGGALPGLRNVSLRASRAPPSDSACAPDPPWPRAGTAAGSWVWLLHPCRSGKRRIAMPTALLRDMRQRTRQRGTAKPSGARFTALHA
jgi:hypothetical protein